MSDRMVRRGGKGSLTAQWGQGFLSCILPWDNLPCSSPRSAYWHYAGRLRYVYRDGTRWDGLRLVRSNTQEGR
jgi:hypothetical protein